MFTINLLKAETVSKDSLNKTVSYLIAAILPAIAIAVMVSLFLGNTAVLASQKRQVAKYDASLAKLSESVKMQKDFDTEKKSINKNLSELSSSLKNYTQWSPILIEVIKNMPDKMIITDLNVRKSPTSRKVTTSDGKRKSIKGFKNTLSLSLSGNSRQNYDSDVREYGNRMNSSEVLKGLGLEQISVSQKEESMDGQKVTSYGIRCVFVNN
ncbi:hypothetical protein KAR04_09355 [Candidatus Calescamantes bacterium]|nr:hypothetical protein [Candidatus Calescamantes bacterium]